MKKAIHREEPQAKGMLCARFASDKKAYDLILYHVEKLTSITDYFLICSGRSTRHVQAIADNILKEMKYRGYLPLGVEGLSQGNWIVLDFNDIVVHVFYEPTREHYRLDDLWAEAPILDLGFGASDEIKGEIEYID